MDCENSFAYYDHQERTTIDGEWTYDELYSDIYDEVTKYYKENNVSKKYMSRAVYDRELINHPQEMIRQVHLNKDLIDVYNTEYSKRRQEDKFGITYFDEWINREIKRLLRENEVIV